MSKNKIVKIVPVKWNVAQMMNEVSSEEDKPLMKRNYIYASELGHPYIDRFYKMKAVPYTNPPNKRSLSKFTAGKIWEYVFKQIFIACGIYREEEVKVDAVPYPGLLAVHGRLDFIAGGYVDKEQAIIDVAALHLPEFLRKKAYRIIENIGGVLLETMVLELKAISVYAMEMIERKRKAIPQHSLQGYHYQKHKKIRAEVCYVCKDNSLMAQFGLDTKACEKLYKEDIEQMTYYYTKNKVPPKDPLAKFDKLLGNFSKHLGVEYSPYLTMIYGFKNPQEYRDAVKFTVRWNRALSRYALAEQGSTTPTGKKIEITANNKAVREEIIKAKYNFEECLKCKIAAGVSEEEIES